MFTQKVFHVRLNLDEAMARLADFRSYRRALDGLDRAYLTSEGTARFEFVTGANFRAEIEVETLTSEEPRQTLFRSVGGNVDLAGLIEFFPVRDQLTEVALSLEYSIQSPIHSVIEAVTASLDRFLNAQLRRIEAHLAGQPLAARRAGASQAGLGQPQLAH